MSRRPSMLTKWTAVIVIVVFTLLLAEFGLRAIGFEVFNPVLTDVYSEPKNALIPHPTYGLALNPGKYSVHLNDALQYQVTHLQDSSRTCLFNKGTQVDGHIYIYGCSISYGMGLNDDKTFPAKIQSAFPSLHIKNFATPGYGTVQSLLQIESHLQNGLIPDLILLGYSSLHDARNMLTGIQQKYWSSTMSSAVNQDLQLSNFPYAILHDNKLDIKFKSLEDFEKNWKASKYSVIVFLFEKAISNIWYGFKDKYQLTEHIVFRIHALCEQRQIPLGIVGLDNGASVGKLERFCKVNAIPFLHAGIDLNDPNMNLEPHDSHPNASAHKLYSKKIINFIKANFQE